MTTLSLASFIRSLITVLKPEKGIWEFREGRRGRRGPISISHQLPTLDDDNGESADSWPEKKGRRGEASQKVGDALATDFRGCGGRRVENDKQHRLLRLPFRLIELGNARMHETISILFPDQSKTSIDICGLWCTLNSYKCTFAEPCTYMGGFGFGIKLKAVFFS